MRIADRVRRAERQLSRLMMPSVEAPTPLHLLTDEELDLLLLCYDQETGAWTGGVGIISDSQAETVCAGLLKLGTGHRDFRRLRVSASTYLVAVQGSGIVPSPEIAALDDAELEARLKKHLPTFAARVAGE